MPDLEFAQMSEILDEIGKRHNAFIFIFEKDGELINTSCSNVVWKGSFTHALGLLDWANTFFQVAKCRKLDPEYES